MTGLAATLLPALSRSQGKLWQDSAKTIPAASGGDPVRVAVCPYTAVELTAPSDAARPLLYDETGGKWSLSFDGVDDCLLSAWSGTAAVTLAAVARASAAGDFPMLLVALPAGRELRLNSTTRRPEVTTDGGGGTATSATAVALDTWVRLIAACGSGGASTEVHADGSQVAADAADANALAATTANVGSRAGANLFWAGRVAGGLFVGAKSSAVAQIDTYLASLV